MVLVLFLLGIVLIIALISFLILLSTLRIDVKKINIISTTNRVNNPDRTVLIYISLLFLGKLKFLQIKIDDDKLKKLNIKERVQKIDIEKLKKQKLVNLNNLKVFTKLPVDLQEFKLKLDVGTIDITLTTIINFLIVLIVSILLPQIIKKYDSEKYYYEIKPIYGDRNMVKLDFSCIFNIKIVHIIDITKLVLKKERVKKNERTSNRRSYDYSYE